MTAVLCGGLPPAIVPGKLCASGTLLDSVPKVDKFWSILEEMLVHKAKGAPVMIFKPTISLFCKTSDNSTNPIAPQGGNLLFSLFLCEILNVEIIFFFL